MKLLLSTLLVLTLISCGEKKEKVTEANWYYTVGLRCVQQQPNSWTLYCMAGEGYLDSGRHHQYWITYEEYNNSKIKPHTCATY
jgi:hypothetical protein